MSFQSNNEDSKISEAAELEPPGWVVRAFTYVKKKNLFCFSEIISLREESILRELSFDKTLPKRFVHRFTA